MNIKQIFQPDFESYEGVRPINIYLLRLVYFLVFVFVGKDSWTFIFNNINAATPIEAVTWSVWAAFSIMCLLGLFKPLKMLPIILLEIIYKLIWLISIAYPLWSSGTLSGSPAAGITQAFVWVILPIIAVPWGYVFKNYLKRK